MKKQILKTCLLIALGIAGLSSCKDDITDAEVQKKYDINQKTECTVTIENVLFQYSIMNNYPVQATDDTDSLYSMNFSINKLNGATLNVSNDSILFSLPYNWGNGTNGYTSLVLDKKMGVIKELHCFDEYIAHFSQSRVSSSGARHTRDLYLKDIPFTFTNDSCIYIDFKDIDLNNYYKSFSFFDSLGIANLGGNYISFSSGNELKFTDSSRIKIVLQ